MAKKPKKNQWHPAFCASMELELEENWDDLSFDSEHQLSRKPLQIDLLIIRNDKNAVIRNQIGHTFRKYKILEYKGSGDALNIDSFYKTNAYACLYKAGAGNVNGYSAEDITITLVRHEYPRGLIKCLLKEGYSVGEAAPGIFRISGKVMFQTQLIVGERLPEEEHIWLTALTRKLTKKQYEIFVDRASAKNQKRARECASAVMEVVSNANKELIKEWKKEEENMMTATLREIFAPELEERERRGEQRGEQRGVQKGEQLYLISMVCRKLKKGKEPEEIAKELEEEIEVVERICNVAKKAKPEYDTDAIYEILQKEEGEKRKMEQCREPVLQND